MDHHNHILKIVWIFHMASKLKCGLPPTQSSRNIGVWPADWKRWAGSNLWRCPSHPRCPVCRVCECMFRVNMCYPWICTDTFGSLHNLVLTPPKLVKYRLNNNNITMLQLYRFCGGKFVPALNRKSLQNRAAWPRVAFTTCHRSTVCVGVDPRGSVWFLLQLSPVQSRCNGRSLTASFTSWYVQNSSRKMIALLDNWRKPVYLTRR